MSCINHNVLVHSISKLSRQFVGGFLVSVFVSLTSLSGTALASGSVSANVDVQQVNEWQIDFFDGSVNTNPESNAASNHMARVSLQLRYSIENWSTSSRNCFYFGGEQAPIDATNADHCENVPDAVEPGKLYGVSFVTSRFQKPAREDNRFPIWFFADANNVVSEPGSGETNNLHQLMLEIENSSPKFLSDEDPSIVDAQCASNADRCLETNLSERDPARVINLRLRIQDEDIVDRDRIEVSVVNGLPSWLQPLPNTIAERSFNNPNSAFPPRQFIEVLTGFSFTSRDVPQGTHDIVIEACDFDPVLVAQGEPKGGCSTTIWRIVNEQTSSDGFARAGDVFSPVSNEQSTNSEEFETINSPGANETPDQPTSITSRGLADRLPDRNPVAGDRAIQRISKEPGKKAESIELQKKVDPNISVFNADNAIKAPELKKEDEKFQRPKNQKSPDGE